MSKKLAVMFCVLLSLAVKPNASEKPSSQADPFQLALLLKSTRIYCRRLERAALDFVCLEEVSERVDLSRDDRQAHVQAMPRDLLVPGTSSRPGGISLRYDNLPKTQLDNAYLFDYQFTSMAGRLKENRVLLSVNGRKAKNDKVPSTLVFRFKDILLTPVQLLSEQNSEYNDFRLLREDRIDGVKAWVLEVKPRIALPDRYLGGQVWLDQDNASVLRIDWDLATFGKYENILSRAKAYKSDPRVESYTEFGFEKKGLRFPSVDYTNEAYIDKDGKVFIRARTKINYKDYKFFTVETETEIKKPPS